MILVTGGSGYLGSHVVRKLVQAGELVRVLVNNPARAEAEGRLKDLEVEWVPGDVTDPDTLRPAVSNTEAIIHTVAIAIEKRGRTYEQINTQGTVNVVDVASELGVRRLINISQLAAAADLPYRFLASKGKAQDYVAQSSLDWTAFRPSVIWGPEDEFANTFARLVAITPLIFPIVGGEEARFQPVWVEDVATSVVKSLRDPSTVRKEFELGGPEVLTLEEIERRTLQAVGARRTLVPFPTSLLWIVVRLMETLLPNPPVTSSLLELLQVSNVTQNNAIDRFVPAPRRFEPEFIGEYMRDFHLRDTVNQYLDRT